MQEDSSRTEFGFPRSKCECRECQVNCRYMPGFLIPADLDRMIPAGADPFEWAESNLLASPGALVSADGKLFRIPTLVPAVKEDGSCTHLQGGKRNGKCTIHQIAPFGCSFFDCGPERGNLSRHGLMAVYDATHEDSLYRKLWLHLSNLGHTQLAPEELRKRINVDIR